MSTFDGLKYEQRRNILKALDKVADAWKRDGIGAGSIRSRGELLLLWLALNDGVGGTLIVAQRPGSTVGIWGRPGPWDAWRFVREVEKPFEEVAADVAEAAGFKIEAGLERGEPSNQLGG